ncbi:MAG: UvrB/UvrC motif-containing protein [bacterium]
MECTYFPEHEATCHLTKVVNGKVVEVHVCEKCIPQLKQADWSDFDVWAAVAKLAASKGKPDPCKAIEPEPTEISAKSLLIPPLALRAVQCPVCGFTSEDVRKTGRLGCPECYEAFSAMLQEVLNDCQKGPRHSGKAPAKMQNVRKDRLEKELRKAIAEERFEDAAKIRDQLAKSDN